MSTLPESDGQPLPDEDADLQAIFRQNCPQFSSVDVDAVLREVAGGKATTTISENHQAAVVGGARSATTTTRAIMLKSLGVIGVCAASICLALVFGPGGSSTVLAQVQNALTKVRTASYTVTMPGGDQSPPIWKVQIKGEHLCRVEQPGGVYLIFDAQSKKVMEVHPGESKVRITENLPVPDGFNLLAQLANLQPPAAKDQPRLPDRDINGIRATGLAVETRGDRLHVWVHPATNLPLLIERRSGNSSAAEQWTGFRFNEEFAANTFAMDVPAGYSVDSHRAAQPKGNASPTTSERPQKTRARSESYGFGPDTPKSR